MDLCFYVNFLILLILGLHNKSFIKLCFPEHRKQALRFVAIVLKLVVTCCIVPSCSIITLLHYGIAGDRYGLLSGLSVILTMCI